MIKYILIASFFTEPWLPPYTQAFQFDTLQACEKAGRTSADYYVCISTIVGDGK